MLPALLTTTVGLICGAKWSDSLEEAVDSDFNLSFPGDFRDDFADDFSGVLGVFGGVLGGVTSIVSDFSRSSTCVPSSSRCSTDDLPKISPASSVSRRSSISPPPSPSRSVSTLFSSRVTRFFIFICMLLYSANRRANLVYKVSRLFSSRTTFWSADSWSKS